MLNTNDTSIDCMVCGETYNSEADMLLHVRTHIEFANSCPFCPYSSLEADTLQTHVITSHAEELKTPTKSSTKSVSPTSYLQEQEVCPLCNENFDHNEISLHVNSHFLDDVDEINSIGTTASNIPKATNNIIPVDIDENKPSCSKQVQQSLMDMMLAKQIESDELKKMHEVKMNEQKAEEIQLKMLQEEFNINPDDKQNFKSQSVKEMEKAVGRRKLTTTEYYSKKFDMLENLEQGIDDKSTFTDSLMEILSPKLYYRSNPDSQWFLTTNVSHFGRGYGDSGWGCGYRNLQMMLSSLIALPQYAQHLHHLRSQIPSIPRLQQMIEDAWSVGFDPRGRDQLENKLAGTRKWIGATEVFTLLCSLKLDCCITDFHRFSDPARKSHPLLFDWVGKYYQQAPSVGQGSVCKCNTPILFLQHQGHSRSIVGIHFNKKQKKVTHLILFDPSHTKKQISSAMVSNDVQNFTSMFLGTPSSFSNSQYQIVSVNGVATNERYEAQKMVDHMSKRIPA